MENIKKGDEVILIKNSEDIPKGAKGIALEDFDTIPHNRVAVKFHKKVEELNNELLGHSCNERCLDEYGWYVEKECLIKYRSLKNLLRG